MSRGAFCGGYLTNGNTIPTAARCCEGFSASSTEVLVGLHDLGNGSEDTRYGYDVSFINMYSGYNRQPQHPCGGDICKPTLSTSVPTSRARPIALDTHHQDQHHWRDNGRRQLGQHRRLRIELSREGRAGCGCTICAEQ
jgi:hypothetical protein